MKSDLLRAAVTARDREQGLSASGMEALQAADEAARSERLAEMLKGQRCAICRLRLNGGNSVGVCSRSKECEAEQKRRWREKRQAALPVAAGHFKVVSCCWPEKLCLELIAPWSKSKLCKRHLRVKKARDWRKTRAD